MDFEFKHFLNVAFVDVAFVDVAFIDVSYLHRKNINFY